MGLLVLVGCSQGGDEGQSDDTGPVSVGTGETTDAPSATEAPETTATQATELATDDSSQPTTAPVTVTELGYKGVTPEPVEAKPIGGAALTAASAEAREAIKPVADQLSSAATLVETLSLTSGGGEVATVSTFAVAEQSASSPRFRDQFLVQVIAVAASETDPRFVDLGGTTVARSRGSISVAAWFDGDQVRLLMPTDGGADLDQLVSTADSLLAS